MDGHGYCHETCRTLQHRWLNVGYNLDQTATFQQLLCLSNKITADSFKANINYITIHVFEYYSFLNTGPIKHCKNIFATLGPTQPSYNFPGTLTFTFCVCWGCVTGLNSVPEGAISYPTWPSL